jgi:tetratricopeptide (TPR) repeat protein
MEGKHMPSEWETSFGFYYFQAAAATDYGRYEKARELLDQALPLANTNHELCLWHICSAGWWHRQRVELPVALEKSIHHYQEAIKMMVTSPDFVTSHPFEMLADIYEEQGMFRKALDVADQALKLVSFPFPFEQRAERLKAKIEKA